MKINTIIIGAGPAGIAAAVQLKRQGVDFIIFEKAQVGGLLLNANLVENYPGCKPMSGVELAQSFEEDLSRLNIEIIYEDVWHVDKKESFIVKTKSDEYKSENLIIASGTTHKQLQSIDFDECVEKKIFYKVYDLRTLTNKEIIIIGGGDAAFDYAINLSKNNRVKILNRSNKTKCLPLLYERASKTEGITYFPNKEITKVFDIDGKLMVTAKTGESYICDCLLVAIGRTPETNFFSEKIKNHFLDNESLAGLYFCGDIKNNRERQLSIAVGDGIRAAMKIGNSK